MSDGWVPAEIDPAAYARLRAGRPNAQWVRLLALTEKSRGASQFVYGTLMQTILFDAEQGCSYLPDLTLPARERALNSLYLQKQFDVDGWVQVLVGCDVDGRDWAQVLCEPPGPREVDHVGHEDSPFWNHLGQNRSELVQLGRRAYG